VFHGSEGSIASRARAARARVAGVTEVGEMVDFNLADAKQELWLARRRGASE
jgi:hypothetical protein